MRALVLAAAVALLLAGPAAAQTVTSPAQQLLSKSFQAPSEGFSIVVPNGVNVLIIAPAGTLTAGTVTFPGAPLDGQPLYFSSTKAVVTLTMTPGAGQTIIGALTAAVIGTGAGWVYRAVDKTWYRIG